jgi:4-hydroxy-tetrahydrodipicolinate reductase
MGKTIERIALDRGHEIVAKIDINSKSIDILKADVAIDFSTPSVALHNIYKCLDEKVPIVSGTTGWLKDYDKAVIKCNQNKGSFLYAPNFSLGVNLFFELNKRLTQLMCNFSNYDLSIEETHHTGKLDAPSGTAISLAEEIIANSEKEKWSLDVTLNNKTIPIVSKREGNVPGTHKIIYNSGEDQIEIIHTAKNRNGFALGALMAAEWLQNKVGVYTMKDVMEI